MPKSFQRLMLLTLTITLWGCASDRNLIILMPDDDGSVGEIVVSNEAGSQSVTQAGHGVSVADTKSEPAKPKKIEQQKIDSLFAKALEAQPQAPARFLLYFKSDSDKLTSESEALIQDIIQAIQERDASDISIVGHTDTKGNKDYNLKLSTQRANSVASLLASQGIETKFFEVTSHGEGNPVVKTEDNVAEARNRRVEVTVR